MEKGDLEPSVPPPPYPGYDIGDSSGSTGPSTTGPSYPPVGPSVYPQPEAGYPVGPIGLTVGQGGYPSGSSGFSQPQSGPTPVPGGYPHGHSKHPNDTVGFPQHPLHPQPAVQQSGETTKLVYHQQPVVTVVTPSAEKFGKQMTLSCIVLVFCFPLGILALILALMAERRALTDRHLAHKLGILSYVFAILGIMSIPIIIGSIVIFM